MPTNYNQFNQFRQGIQGNPQQMVQSMLQNGQMSQEQFNQLSSIARAAADAKKTGDEIGELRSGFSELSARLEALGV